MAKETAIFAFFGNDEALVKEAALQLSGKLAPADNEFGLETINGRADNAEHAVRILADTVEAIQTLPFFGGEKVVWLQGANFFGDSQTGKAESTLSSVESLVTLLEGGLPPDVKLIISASEVDKRRAFYKRLGKLAQVKTFDKVDTAKSGWETTVMAQVAARAKKLGIDFERGALDRFVLLVGAETRLLDSELEKLSLYTGGRAATEEDVAAVVSPGHVGVIFAIGDAIGKRRLALALDLIDEQLRAGESAIGILLASIVPKIRGLLHARDLIERHRLRVSRDFKQFERTVASLPDRETAHFPRKKDGTLSLYPTFLAAQASDRFSAEDLRNALECCLEANERLVTTQLEPRMVLNQLVTRILTQPS